MIEERDGKAILKKILPRVVKAVLSGIIIYLAFYFLSSLIPEVLFLGYEQLIFVFTMILIVFAVLHELSAGTILQYAFSFAKALLLIIYFVYALNGGIITATIGNMHFTVDIRVFLAMLVFVNVLGLTKSVFEAINFLSGKEE